MSLTSRILNNKFLVKYTWQIEAGFVFICLLTVLIFTHKNWHEYLGSLAVMATFLHGQVADRLAYSQSLKKQSDVPCYKWLWRYYLTKEIAWVAYFVLLEAWSALFGAVLFLVYPLWRKLYHSYHPKDD